MAMMRSSRHIWEHGGREEKEDGSWLFSQSHHDFTVLFGFYTKTLACVRTSQHDYPSHL